MAVEDIITKYQSTIITTNKLFTDNKRLRKTIRAELDEDLLEQFHGTVSLPFKAGENRRVAVKIVDDRGIESLKIMGLE